MSEKEAKKPSKSRIPWVCLSTGFILDPKLKKARARAVFPWVLTVLKRFENNAPSEELCHEIAAIDLDLSEVDTGRQMAGLRRVGLLIEDEHGFCSTPNWYKYQRDNRKNRRAPAKSAVDHTPKQSDGGGSRAAYVNDPPQTSNTVNDPPNDAAYVNDPPNGDPLRQGSDPAVDRPMSTVDRHCSSQASSLRDPHLKGATPASPSPWGWRKIWTKDGRIRWEVGSIEEAFVKLWPKERIGKQLRGYARELSVTPAETLDRAFELVSPECLLAGDEYPRPYWMRKALNEVGKSEPPMSTAAQMDAEARQANMSRLLGGDASARRDRETYAEEFFNANERPPEGPVLKAVRMSYTERELAIPELFA